MTKQLGKIRRIWMIYGPSGVGKTQSLASFCDAGLKVKVLDADMQAHLRHAALIKKGMLQVEVWTSFAQVGALYSALLNGKNLGVDVVAFDSLSQANEEFVREDQATPESKGTEKKALKQPEWGLDRKPAAEMLTSLLLWGKRLANPAMVKYPVHVVYITHEMIRMVGPAGMNKKEQEQGTEGRVVARGPSLPGKLLQLGGSYVQELYHMVMAPDAEDASQINRWFITQPIDEWPAKGSATLDAYEEPDFAKLLAKLGD